MKRYKNESGKSGVVAYEIGDDWIEVKFIENGIYKYSYANPGKTHVERMKKLARSGRGLATYISQNVKDFYDQVYS